MSAMQYELSGIKKDIILQQRPDLSQAIQGSDECIVLRHESVY